MPLDVDGLHSAFSDLFGDHPPSSAPEAAHAWAQALSSYAAGIVPASTTVSAAAATLEPALLAAFTSPAAPPLLELAFLQFATAVGLGMAPAFVATPPPAPVGFALLGAPPFPTSRAAAVDAWVSAIDTWMHTGIGTPPIGPPVPWS